jgi:HK97 family phage prohead protease
MKTKDLAVEVKAGPEDGLEEGQFEAYASVFGNVDSYGDVVQRGAFTNTLAEWAASGNFLPVLFGHNMADPDFNLGHVVTAAEDERGLRVRGQLDMDSPKAAQVHRMLKGRRLSQLSFAYDVVRGSWGQLDGADVYELHEVKLYEVSLVTIGANQETEVLAVKTAAESLAGGVQEGRVISAANLESLRSARDSIDSVLAAAEAGQGEGKASGNGLEVKDEGAERVKFEDPGPSPSVLAWEALEAELAAEGV